MICSTGIAGIPHPEGRVCVMKSTEPDLDSGFREHDDDACSSNMQGCTWCLICTFGGEEPIDALEEPSWWTILDSLPSCRLDYI